MPTSNIEVVEIGIPGPPGAGVTSSEKSSFAIKSGANIFTAAQTITKSGTSALVVEQDDGTDVLVVDSTNKEVEIHNAGDLRIFSDAGTTEVASIDGATGNIQTDGTLTVDGHVIAGEQLWLSFRCYEGGSVLTTGVKDFAVVPYNCVIESDGTKAWFVGVDPSGSISWDLWYTTSWPPTSANRISGTVGTQNPRVTTAASASSASLTGWTTTLTKGGYLFASIAGTPATSTRAILGLHIRKTT